MLHRFRRVQHPYSLYTTEKRVAAVATIRPEKPAKANRHANENGQTLDIQRPERAPLGLVTVWMLSVLAVAGAPNMMIRLNDDHRR